ncbi:hypothetical protein [Nocardia sp. NPDC058666]|uniref:DUF7373 family lipoprotein n=1 Tax=unclassified Nocardia TaxID=2637762 RepID=UPI0036588729
MRSSRPVRAACAALTAALLTTVAACGSADSPQAVDPPVDLAALDVGNYPTQPRRLGTVTSMPQARWIEAERLGDYVPTPGDIDPRFVHANPWMASVFLEPDKSLGRFMAIDRFAEAAPDFIGGFVSSGESEPNNDGIELVNAVMIFPDEQRAAAAAIALEQLDFGYAANQPIEIPGYPAAKAHWQPHKQSIGSWYATGHLVVYTWIYDYPKMFLKQVDKQALLDLTRKSLDTVVPSIAEFTPTPSDKMLELPRDREDIRARTLPRPKDDGWINPPGAYAARTSRHFASNPLEVAQFIDENGVDLYSVDGAEVYRARDVAGAQAVRDEMGGLTRKFTRTAAPKDLPTALCKEYIGRQKRLTIRFYCAVSYDRYAAYTWSNQLLDAQQRISAQYALLVNTK